MRSANASEFTRFKKHMSTQSTYQNTEKGIKQVNNFTNYITRFTTINLNRFLPHSKYNETISIVPTIRIYNGLTARDGNLNPLNGGGAHVSPSIILSAGMASTVI
jgi:hypothetical protein